MFAPFALIAVTRAFDPDAGVVRSLTDGATPMGSGNAAALGNILDGDVDTQWQSDACYPTGYLARPDLDVALGRCAADGCSGTTTGLSALTDGSLGAGVEVPVGAGVAAVRLSLAEASTLARIRVFGTFAQPVEVIGETADGVEVPLGALAASSDARTAVNLDVSAGEAFSAVRFQSAGAVRLYELATLVDTCFVYGGVDLGAPTEIGWLRLRHWAGGYADRSQVMVSDDGVAWAPIVELDPASLAQADIVLPEAVRARYVVVRHDLRDGDWYKAYVWELDAYGPDGFYGPAPAAVPNPVAFSALLGVNGIWGWGTSAFSDSAAAGQGPDLWTGLVGHARNYHNLSWDVTDPDHVPDYDAMANGEGTEAQWWLDWDREYEAWEARTGAAVEASIQFTDGSFPEAAFDDPWRAGFGYGEAFAAHFGPTAGNGWVEALEVGNEPWDYSAPMYAAYLEGMVAGVNAGDPAMLVTSGAFQAHTPELPGDVGGNYVGARVTEAAVADMDALNIHAYSFAYDDAGVRRGVPPEDPRSSMREVFAALRWRDANMPGKPVWLTEWGWDSDGGGESCTGTECVPEVAQARYLVRGALLGSRWGLSRMTWYFFANVEGSTGLFGRSGLLASRAGGFSPKRGYMALTALQSAIGDRRFVAALREDAEAHVYLLGDADGAPTHLVAWAPIAGEDSAATQLVVDAPGQATAAFTLDGVDPAGEAAPLPLDAGGTWTLTIGAAPSFVAFVPADDTGALDDSGSDEDEVDEVPTADTATGAPIDGCGCAAASVGPDARRRMRSAVCGLAVLAAVAVRRRALSP